MLILIVLAVIVGIAAVGLLSYFTMPGPGHACSKCDGWIMFDIPHTCKPLSKAEVREIVQEVIKEQEKTGFPLYDSEGSYLDRE